MRGHDEKDVWYDTSTKKMHVHSSIPLPFGGCW